MLKHIESVEEFDKEIGSGEKVLADFFATWCGPCRMLSPVLEEIASEDEAKTILKVDVDKVPALASRYGVSSIPTLILFEGGKDKAASVGYLPKDRVLRFIEEGK